MQLDLEQLRTLRAVVEQGTLDAAATALHVTPSAVSQRLKALETAAGRVRTERWGPRTLDVDVLLVDDLVVDEPDLQVPHPRLWERAFVLIPLADLAPDLVPDRPVDAGVRRVAG